jgi:GNAT superfamily N-acetyltransferase
VPQELVAARHRDSFWTRAARRVDDTTVAVVDAEVAGFVMVVGDEVEQVYVAGRHRGSGVADTLMTEAERQIAGAGHSTAWLAVVAGNSRARRFYERRGWMDGGAFDYAAVGEDGPISVPSRRYVKHLS